MVNLFNKVELFVAVSSSVGNPQLRRRPLLCVVFSIVAITNAVTDGPVFEIAPPRDVLFNCTVVRELIAESVVFPETAAA